MKSLIAAAVAFLAGLAVAYADQNAPQASPRGAPGLHASTAQ